MRSAVKYGYDRNSEPQLELFCEERAQPPPRHQRNRPSSPALHILPPPSPAAAPPSPSIVLPVAGSGANAIAQTSAVWSRRVDRARDGAERSHSLIVPSDEL